MSVTIATNIRLPEDLLKALKYRAIEEKKSVNQIIREAIEMSLAAAPQTKERQRDPLEDVIGIARSGIKDASSKHDRGCSCKPAPRGLPSSLMQPRGARTPARLNSRPVANGYLSRSLSYKTTRPCQAATYG